MSKKQKSIFYILLLELLEKIKPLFNRLISKISKKLEIIFNILIIAGVLFTFYNTHAYNKSFDRCMDLVDQIHKSTQTLHNEITALQISMGAIEVDYE